MRQILQSYRTGELWLADVPAAACRRGGVLVRSSRSLVSPGTERMVMQLAKKSLLGKARARPDLVRQVFKKIKSDGLGPTLGKVFAKLDEPISLGYSVAGSVVESGRDAAGFQPGDRVAVAGAGYATHAEFNFVPFNLCARIPDGVGDDDAAFTTLGAIALQGVRQADPQLGERIVVIGLGMLGLITVQILKANGCAVLGVDPDQARVDLALELGADAAVTGDVQAASDAFTGGRGADAVILSAATSSNEPIENAAAISRAKGRVVVVGVVGMNIPRDAFYTKELDLRLSMSYGPGRYDSEYEEGGHDYPYAYVRFTEQRNMESFLYLVEQGSVTPSKLVTHRIAFDDALDAYELLDQGAKDVLGILLEYAEDVPLVRTVAAGKGANQARGTGRQDVGVAFVGAGGFANGVLLPELGKLAKADRVHLTGVCATTGKSAQQSAQKHGFAFSTTDLDEVLDNDATDAVFVVTTHASHASLTERALRAGKHVFVEKPLCLRESELDELALALEETRAAGHSPCLMVGFNRRFSPHAAAIREAFTPRSGPMSVVYRVNAGRIPLSHWIQDPDVGGGRILGEACHFVDLCGFLIGSTPMSVSALSVASDRRDVVAQDSVVIVIQYADGSLATIHYLAEGHRDMPKERCEVFADGKSAVLENFRVTELFGAQGRGLRGRQEKGFAEELDAFVGACVRGGDWPIAWEDLVATHRVGFAALRSLETGIPVRIDAL